MAVAAGSGAEPWPDAALLAAAALEHAEAGSRASATRGLGGATPLAVAEALGDQQQTNAESNTVYVQE
jgi:NAD(P)H-hydrate epimerase